MQRENWIDWAKALGILLVVMGHSVYASKDVTSFIFVIHMPLFFFVSGYLFKTSRSWHEISVSNVKTLLVPYIGFNIIGFFYYLAICIAKICISGGVDWNLYIINQLWRTIFGLANGIFVGPTWFLLALIWCRYLCKIVMTSWKHAFVGIALWAVLMYVRRESGVQYPFSIDCGLAGALWFTAGILFKRYKQLITVPKALWCAIVVVAGWLCWENYLQYGQPNYIVAKFNGVMGVLGTAVGLVAFFGLCKLLNGVKVPFIVEVSKASIVVMCLHMMAMRPLQALTHYQGGTIGTLLGDCFLVVLLTLIYPLIKKYVPALTGNR